jgi:septum formation protein
MSRIVLASGSPRRQELLNRIGITDFDIRVPQTDEHYPAGLTPAQIVEYISREKADAAAKGVYLKKVALSSTMGIGARVDLSTLSN